jgi:hypothetical protein
MYNQPMANMQMPRTFHQDMNFQANYAATSFNPSVAMPSTYDFGNGMGGSFGGNLAFGSNNISAMPFNDVVSFVPDTASMLPHTPDQYQHNFGSMTTSAQPTRRNSNDQQQKSPIGKIEGSTSQLPSPAQSVPQDQITQSPSPGTEHEKPAIPLTTSIDSGLNMDFDNFTQYDGPADTNPYDGGMDNSSFSGGFGLGINGLGEHPTFTL